MSENKYIIDKDSLTGIADAVRDKLGTGEATTDPQTGDIVYPEDKGYYLKETTVAKISGFGWSKTGYNGNFGQSYAPYITGEDWNAAVGEPWYSVEITLVNVSSTYLYNMDVYYTGGSKSFTNVGSSTYTVSVPNGSTYFQLFFGDSFSSNKRNANASLGSLTAIFKDAEGKPIKPKQSSYHYLWTSDRIQSTANFGTASVPTPIPYSIDDIQDKITNYLKTTSSSKIVLLSNFYVRGKTYADVTNLKPYGGLSNIDLIVGRYDSNSLGYLDMVNHPNRVGTYNGYDTYRFYRSNAGTETYLMDVQHDTLYGKDQLYQMTGSYGLTLSPCFIIYKEA